MRLRCLLILTFAFSALVASARDGLAYKCLPAKNSTTVTQAWNQRCLPYTINNTSAILAVEGMRELIAQSWAVWNNRSCTDLDFRDMGFTDQTPGFDERRADNENVIYGAELAEELHYFDDPMELAVTLTSHSIQTGEILDADIIINHIRFDFADVADTTDCRRQTPMPYDLRNTLVHEMGHFIGFEHDDDPESTMFANAQACEIDKRTLSNDNIAGICAVYPSNQSTHTCRPPLDYGSDTAAFRDQCGLGGTGPGGGGPCSCSSTHEGHSTGASLALLAFVAARRRRS